MRLQLEGTSLSDLQAQVLAEHGTTATIVRVEKVTVGGIRGFFARRHYELIVEVSQRPDGQPDASPEAAPVPEAVLPGAILPGEVADALLDLPARVGLAALLERAEEDEGQLNGMAGGTPTVSGRGEAGIRRGDGGETARVPAENVSTRSDTFAGILADLASITAEPAPQVVTPDSPRPLRGAGDLVVVVGMGEDPYLVADALASTAGAGEVSVAGELSIVGAQRVDDRRTALTARVQGVQSGHSVFVALGLGDTSPDVSTLRSRGAAIQQLHPDQVWAAVDVGRPPDDTAAWMRAIGSVVSVDAVAMVGVQQRLR
ncbi:hypothetical protein GCM10027052_28080 [Parafrigoribacterium mesophilum]|uniref:hypothetical protein n=1 Tax=Parafrigoribacterium mesophilum TaxID=433646 RepID=UPI0031FD947F